MFKKEWVKHFSILLFSLFFLTGAGCQISFGGGGRDGGVFKSLDRGNNWTQKVLIPTTKERMSIAATNVLTLTQDPQDSKAIYIGTKEDGLFYTYDGGENWFLAKDLSRLPISALSVDPKSKCIIYASSQNRIFKTTDCSRNWQVVYYDSRPAVVVSSLAVDSFNPAGVWAGISNSEIIKSTDYGKSWGVLKRFEDSITDITISPFDTRIVYIITKNRGVFKTIDGGKTWQDLNKDLMKFSGALSIRNLELDLTQKDHLVILTAYGMFQSFNGGINWQPVSLLTPPNSVILYSLALNPKNGKEIYYGTASTFYRTVDGGKNWITKKLPTRRAASALLVSWEDPNIVYLGVRRIEQ